MRTNYRNEDIYLYHTTAPPARARERFLEYVHSLNALRTQPRWYNAIIIASHHFSETDHLAFDFTFWAPTGSYQKGKLVNLSTNSWTFIPGVAFGGQSGNASARWIHDFDVSKRVEGDGFNFTASLKF